MPPRSIRILIWGVVSSAFWPAYGLLLAHAAHMGPWPRSLGRPLWFAIAALSIAAFVKSLTRFAFQPGGWCETFLDAPENVGKQARRLSLILIVSALVLLLPKVMLEHGLLSPAERSVSAPAICRVLGLTFEVVAWGAVYCLLSRKRSAVVNWLFDFADEQNARASKRYAIVVSLFLAALAGLISLDAAGYGFSARRLTIGGVQTIAVLASAKALYWAVVQTIERHSWRWIIRSTHGYGQPENEDAEETHDLPGRLRRLAGWIVPMIGLLALAWVWDFDTALLRAIGRRPVWPPRGDAEVPGAITVADLFGSLAAFLITGFAWRHLGAIFALIVYPRMADDPGVRFALLTLCRYAVLAVGGLAGLSAIHLGVKEIGVVLAALGVGLGFGLQEIVSNFVSGIILLLERPIRVGDVVTVNNMSGKVDRINIRATTIINGDNQSMIIPNRAFITGDLINWTHKDKIVRLAIKFGISYDADPDRVVDLLLAIVREDPDALQNPLPSAQIDAFNQGWIDFSLSVHVPEPSLIGRVRHRLCAEIKRRFAEEGIVIPYPIRELHIRAGDANPAEAAATVRRNPIRIDSAATAITAPHFADSSKIEPAPINRIVDE